MAETKKPARELPKFILRFPEQLRDALKAEADDNNRSMTAEIVTRLEESFRYKVFIGNHLMRRIRFIARGNRHSVNDEIIQTLESLYPEIPSVDEIVEDLDSLISRAEELGVGGEDGLFKKRVLEHLGKLRERIHTILDVSQVDTGKES